MKHIFIKIVVEDEALNEPLTYTEKVAKFSLGDFTEMFAYQECSCRKCLVTMILPTTMCGNRSGCLWLLKRQAADFKYDTGSWQRTYSLFVFIVDQHPPGCFVNCRGQLRQMIFTESCWCFVSTGRLSLTGTISSLLIRMFLRKNNRRLQRQSSPEHGKW